MGNWKIVRTQHSKACRNDKPPENILICKTFLNSIFNGRFDDLIGNFRCLFYMLHGLLFTLKYELNYVCGSHSAVQRVDGIG